MLRHADGGARGARRRARAWRRLRRRVRRPRAGRPRRDRGQQGQLHALHPAAAGGRFGNPRAPPLRRPPARDVLARRADPGDGDRRRPRGADGRGRDRRGPADGRLARAGARARRGSPHAAAAGARRARPLLQDARRRDLPAQPRPAPARSGGRGARRGRARPAAHLRLRRSRLRGGRGSRRALRPGRGRPPLLSAAPLDAAAPRILPEIPHRLGDYAAEELHARGVEIHVGTTLASVSEHEAVLGNGTRIPTRTLVWTAGVSPSPLLRQWPLPLDERGRVEVDELLRVRGREHVWALGDCARVPNTRSDRPDPPTCQHALRQARRLAKNLTGRLEPYGYRMLGQVATLGRHKGIAEVLGLKLRGFPGWWVARTYHLYQLPLAQRKLRVVADWTVSLCFRRDIAELGQLGHPEGLG